MRRPFEAIQVSARILWGAILWWWERWWGADADIWQRWGLNGFVCLVLIVIDRWCLRFFKKMHKALLLTTWSLFSVILCKNSNIKEMLKSAYRDISYSQYGDLQLRFVIDFISYTLKFIKSLPIKFNYTSNTPELSNFMITSTEKSIEPLSSAKRGD